MTGETGAAADAITGAIVAAAVEPAAGSAPARGGDDAHAACRNCGAMITGAYCSTCGQAVHIHRSLGSLGHDILHSVFHFEGKIWRTLPELALNPGRLTRRYIDGERAKFVSPMALYLFAVFLMYAVFSFTAGHGVEGAPGAEDLGAAGNGPVDVLERRIDDVQRQLAEAPQGAEAAALERDALPENPPNALTRGLAAGFKTFAANPNLAIYKIKTNGYKYSWALVPLSLPFMWLMFPRRRDIRMYDHAVFVTYSITFVMMLFTVMQILSAAGVSMVVTAVAQQVIPPVHMYRHLRGTYALSVAAAFGRLVALLFAAAIVLSVFIGGLFAMGVLG